MSGKILLFGFDSLLNVLALEKAVKPFGVELVPVARTDYNKTLSALAEETPIGRNGTPMDIAKAMVYLSEADFVTGHILTVDGGFVI